MPPTPARLRWEADRGTDPLGVVRRTAARRPRPAGALVGGSAARGDGRARRLPRPGEAPGVLAAPPAGTGGSPEFRAEVREMRAREMRWMIAAVVIALSAVLAGGLADAQTIASIMTARLMEQNQKTAEGAHQ